MVAPASAEAGQQSKVMSAPLTPRTLANKAFEVSIETKILSQLLLLAGIHYL
jgi:hypothetical protein